MYKCKNKISYVAMFFTSLIAYSNLSFGQENIDLVIDRAEVILLRENLAQFLNEDEMIESIQESEMQGVYIVTVNGRELFVYNKKNHFMIGDIYDVKTQESLKAKRSAQKIFAAVEQIPESEMIVMNKLRGRYLTVFTDTDCFYCQKLHKEVVPELQKKGVQVRYLMFPQAGLDSDSYHEAVSVWCADDQAKAMTRAKSGRRIKSGNCDNPVEDQYLLGQQLGIRGTPTTALDNGKVIPGFFPANILLKEMEMAN